MDAYTFKLSNMQLTTILESLRGYIKLNRRFANTFGSRSKTRKHILEVSIPACEQLIKDLEDIRSNPTYNNG